MQLEDGDAVYRAATCALHPMLTKLSDQIQRSGDENGVFGPGFGQQVIHRLFGIADYGAVGDVMRGYFTQLGCGDSARGARLGENNL